MNLKIIYEDRDLIVVDKPAGIVVFHETGNMKHETKTVIDYLLEKYPDLKNAGEPPRHGIIHRLDKDTSGILLIAKTNEALIFFQKQFKNREVDKKYMTLATGTIKDNSGTIHTLIGRANNDPRKQSAHSLGYMGKTGLREAISNYKVLERFENYTLLEVEIKTGRKHQIRCHMAYIHHPVAGDKLYGFKDSPVPDRLTRQFLHASYLKIEMPNGQIKEFKSELPNDLKNILNTLNDKMIS